MKTAILIAAMLTICLMAIASASTDTTALIKGGWDHDGNKASFFATLGVSPIDVANLRELADWNLDVTVECQAIDNSNNETVTVTAPVLGKIWFSSKEDTSNIYIESIIPTNESMYKLTDDIKGISIKKKVINFSY